MLASASYTTLSFAHIVLRTLIVLNWLSGVVIFVLLAASTNTPFMMSAFKLAPSPEADSLILGMRIIAAIGICAIPLHNAFLRRMIEIVATVQLGDPFVTVNASRLRSMAWILLTLQCFSIIIGAIANRVSTLKYPLHLDAGFSISGWLAVIVIFVLAQVFSVGSQMRMDLEGTV